MGDSRRVSGSSLLWEETGPGFVPQLWCPDSTPVVDRQVPGALAAPSLLRRDEARNVTLWDPTRSAHVPRARPALASLGLSPQHDKREACAQGSRPSTQGRERTLLLGQGLTPQDILNVTSVVGHFPRSAVGCFAKGHVVELTLTLGG